VDFGLAFQRWSDLCGSAGLVFFVVHGRNSVHIPVGYILQSSIRGHQGLWHGDFIRQLVPAEFYPSLEGVRADLFDLHWIILCCSNIHRFVLFNYFGPKRCIKYIILRIHL
jgi:hypothetical protein